MLSTYVLCACAAVLGTAALLRWRLINSKMLKLADMLPGPPTVPILGNAYLFVNMGVLDRVTWLMRNYGEYVKFWMGPELQIFIANPTDVRHILSSNKVNQKGKFYGILEQALGKGLITGGQTWRSHRKLANPTYSRKLGPGYCEVFNQEAEELIRTLGHKDPRVHFNLLPEVLWSTTQCVCRTLMNLTKQESMNIKRLKEVIDFTDDMYTVAFKQITIWYLWIPPVYSALGYKSLMNYYKKASSELAMDIISKRRRDLTSRNIKEKDLQDEQGVVDGFGVVDRFILSDEFTEQEKAEETFTLFTASQESSGKLTTFLLFFLAYKPEWQEKIYNELVQEIGEDKPLTEEDLKKLVYLDAMFRETLRYMPIAACIQRLVQEDITLEKSNITIPAGTPIILPIHAMHRDTKYWDQPDLVMPERFLSENNKKKEPEAYLPFSLGVMDCLGRTFAINLVKILAARVVRNFRLSAKGKMEDLELDVAISTKFKNGCPVTVERRKPAA